MLDGMLCGAASGRGDDAGWVTVVMLLLVMVVMVGGWAITTASRCPALGVCFGCVSGEPSSRIRFFHGYFHAVLSRGDIANPWCGGGSSILGSVSGPRWCCGCQLTASQSVGDGLSPSSFCRVCVGRSECFGLFCRRFARYPVVSPPTRRPVPCLENLELEIIACRNIENPK